MYGPNGLRDGLAAETAGLSIKNVFCRLFLWAFHRRIAARRACLTPGQGARHVDGQFTPATVDLATWLRCNRIMKQIGQPIMEMFVSASAGYKASRNAMECVPNRQKEESHHD